MMNWYSEKSKEVSRK